jgi:hypothetical protein
VIRSRLEDAASAFIGRQGRRRSGEPVRSCSRNRARPGRRRTPRHPPASAPGREGCLSFAIVAPPLPGRWGRRAKPQAAGAVRIARPSIDVPATSEQEVQG